MVFFSAVFAARSPAMGNSADRAWQLSQLAEGVLTAFNPSHGSLSCVQAGHCVSKQIGRHDAACQGCPRCVSRSPKARFRIVARCARFPTCGVVRVAGYSVVWDCDPTPIFSLKSTKRSAAAILGRNAPSLLFMVRFGCRSCYISRYVNLKFGFLPFVVASIFAMVFLRRICSSRPGDGEQRGQSLAALTARGRGLDCLQPQLRQPVLRAGRTLCVQTDWAA